MWNTTICKYIINAMKNSKKDKMQTLVFIIVLYYSAYVYYHQVPNRVRVLLFQGLWPKPPKFTIGL